jgi:hypothetical protein
VKQILINNIKNIHGRRTKEKIVIIECDDWGGIRMPSKVVLDSLISEGLNIGQGRYNRYDSLENYYDLQKLFEILTTVRDSENKHCVMTAITNVANPNFRKIKEGNFEVYYNEKFIDTLNNYYPDEDVFGLWKEGIDAGIFIPELHGREHLSVQSWMRRLREGNKDLHIAFDKGFVALSLPDQLPLEKEFRAEFFFRSEDEKPFLIKSINEGIIYFQEIFGRLPRVFVPSNQVFHPEFETIIANSGVKYLYVSHSMPIPIEGGGIKYRHFMNWHKSNSGIVYYTRNCAFEPTDKGYKGIETTLKQIAASFRWGNPANISTHRVNFAGGIDPSNREKGLIELKKLLQAIVLMWPDVKFMSSGDAFDSLGEKP